MSPSSPESYFVTGPDGRESGPYPLDTLVFWAQNGQLPPAASLRGASSGATFLAGEAEWLQGKFPQKTAPPSVSEKLIPRRNPMALAGYYSGLLSCIPVLGLLTALFGLYFSIRGLQDHKANPEIHGRTHALVALVASLIGLVVNGFIVVSLATSIIFVRGS